MRPQIKKWFNKWYWRTHNWSWASPTTRPTIEDAYRAGFERGRKFEQAAALDRTLEGRHDQTPNP